MNRSHSLRNRNRNRRIPNTAVARSPVPGRARIDCREGIRTPRQAKRRQKTAAELAATGNGIKNRGRKTGIGSGRRVREDEQPNEISQAHRHGEQSGAPECCSAHRPPRSTVGTNRAHHEIALGIENAEHSGRESPPEPVGRENPLTADPDSGTTLVAERVIEQLENGRRIDGDALGQRVETEDEGMNGDKTVRKNGGLRGRRLCRLGSRLEIDTRTRRRGEPKDNEDDAEQNETVDEWLSQEADQEAEHDLVNIKSIGITTGTTLRNKNRRCESAEHVHGGSLNTAEQDYPVRIGWTHGRPIRTTTRDRRRRNDDGVEIRRTERQARGIAPRGHGNEQGSRNDPTGFELEKRLRDERIRELGWRKDPHGSGPLGDEPVRISAAPIGGADMISTPRG